MIFKIKLKINFYNNLILKYLIIMTIKNNINSFCDYPNEVEEYLKKNNNKILSLRNIYKNIGIKRKKAIWLINNSKKIKLVNPLCVGSNKYFLHIYTYIE